MEKRDLRRAGLEFLRTLVIAFILAQVVMVSVAQAFQVEQYSMEPNLLPRDRVLVNKFLYRFAQPHEGQIVVIHPPDFPQRNYIKRVVGDPGPVDLDPRRARLRRQPAAVGALPARGYRRDVRADHGSRAGYLRARR